MASAQRNLSSLQAECRGIIHVSLRISLRIFLPSFLFGYQTCICMCVVLPGCLYDHGWINTDCHRGLYTMLSASSLTGYNERNYKRSKGAGRRGSATKGGERNSSCCVSSSAPIQGKQSSVTILECTIKHETLNCVGYKVD